MCPRADFEGVAHPGSRGREARGRTHLAARRLPGFRGSQGPSRSDAWRLRKAASLVKLLALTPGHRLHRERAMDLLWPDLAKKAASNNLRGTLHAARKALGRRQAPATWPPRTSRSCCVPGGELWVDVEAFEEAALTARRSRDPAAYRAAIDLYAGDLLPEDRYEEWAEAGARRLRRTVPRAAHRARGAPRRTRRVRAGHRGAQEAMAEEPTHEEAHVALMRLHALSGRPERSPGAVRTAPRCSL